LQLEYLSHAVIHLIFSFFTALSLIFK